MSIIMRRAVQLSFIWNNWCSIKSNYIFVLFSQGLVRYLNHSTIDIILSDGFIICLFRKPNRNIVQYIKWSLAER